MENLITTTTTTTTTRTFVAVSKSRNDDWFLKLWKLSLKLRDWWLGAVVSALALFNEVNRRRARLVLGWVTVDR